MCLFVCPVRQGRREEESRAGLVKKKKTGALEIKERGEGRGSGERDTEEASGAGEGHKKQLQQGGASMASCKRGGL